MSRTNPRSRVHATSVFLFLFLPLLVAGANAQQNLITNSEFDDLSGWDTTGQWSTPQIDVPWDPTAIGNKVAKVTDAGNPSKLRWGQEISMLGSHLYEISCYVKRDSTLRVLDGKNEVGYRVTMAFFDANRDVVQEVKWRYNRFDTDGWTRVRRRFGVRTDSDMRFVLRCSNFSGSVLIDRLSLVDVTNESTQQKIVDHPEFGPITYHLVDAPASNHHFPWDHTPTPSLSPPGPIATFVRDADHIGPNTVPAAGEIADRNTWYGARGDTIAAVFGLHATAASTVTIQAEAEFRPVGGGPGFAADGRIRLLIAEAHDQRFQDVDTLLVPTGDLVFMRVLERLLERDTVTLGAGETTAVWALVDVPVDVGSGVYENTLTLTTGLAPAVQFTLRLDLEDFAVEAPEDTFWALDTELRRWSQMSPSQQSAEIRDWADHGINVLANTGVAGDLVFENGEFVEWRAPRITPKLQEFVDAGMRGMIMKWESRIEQRVRTARQLGAISFSDPWPPALVDGYRDVLTWVDQFLATGPLPLWWYAGLDEPRSLDDRKHAAQQAVHLPDRWQSNEPIRRTITSDIEFVGAPLPSGLSLLEDLTSRAYNKHYSILRPEQAAARGHESAFGGYDFWFYGAGSYRAHDGNMIRNRLMNGFLYWKLYAQSTGRASEGSNGAVMSWNWVWRRAVGVLDDDFDGGTKDYAITYEHPDGTTIDTPQWEGVRQGVQDFRCAATFDRKRSEFAASGDPDRIAFAAALRAEFDAVLASIPYWMDAVFTVDRVSNVAMDAARRRIRDLIAELEDYPGGTGDLVFADGFETGDLSRWSSVSTAAGGVLNVTQSAATAGDFGLETKLLPGSGAPSAYVEDRTPDREARYRAGFRWVFDPARITLGNSVAGILVARDDTWNGGAAVVRVRFRRFNGAYQIRAETRTDANAMVPTAWVPYSGIGVPAHVEVSWSSGPRNGSLALRVNGAEVASLDSLVNGSIRIDRTRVGAALGFAGATGTMQFDEFTSHRSEASGQPR